MKSVTLYVIHFCHNVKVSLPKVKVYGPKQIKTLPQNRGPSACSRSLSPEHAWPSPPASFPGGSLSLWSSSHQPLELKDHGPTDHQLAAAALEHTLAFLPLFPPGIFSLPFFCLSSKALFCFNNLFPEPCREDGSLLPL